MNEIINVHLNMDKPIACSSWTCPGLHRVQHVRRGHFGHFQEELLKPVIPETPELMTKPALALFFIRKGQAAI